MSETAAVTIPVRNLLAAACPGCDCPAVHPWLVRNQQDGSMVAHYWCPAQGCGRKWTATA